MIGNDCVCSEYLIWVNSSEIAGEMKSGDRISGYAELLAAAERTFITE